MKIPANRIVHGMSTTFQIIAVATGGAIGALSRFAIATLIPSRLPGTHTSFPFATLTANIVGCLLIGLCYVWFVERTADEWTRKLIITGFLGALTTFSTFALESFMLAEEGRVAVAVLYLLSSVVLGGLATVMGIGIARLT